MSIERVQKLEAVLFDCQKLFALKNDIIDKQYELIACVIKAIETGKTDEVLPTLKTILKSYKDQI